ncbi:MAG: hypothetical protein KDC83_06580 [Flavobacteriales bacterium]|nr:hypothetical protein [Flavobacteriales bacterium]
MSWNDIIYGTGDFLTKSFEILPMLGNNMNYLIMIVGGAMGVWWISQLVKFSKESKGNPSAE